jgi:hypothetical protein
LWPTLSTATSLEELVEAVLEIGLRNLPTIAIAYRADTETHVLLRGSARGAVDPGGDLPVQVLASDAQTWKEHAVTGPVRLFVGELSEGGDLPLSSGVVPADALSVDWSTSFAEPRAPEARPHADLILPPEVDAEIVDRGVTVEPEVVPEAEREVAPEAEREVAPEAASPPVPVEAEVTDGATILEPPIAVVPGDYPDSTMTENDLLDLDDARPERAVAPGPPPAESSRGIPLDDEDSFDDLFGATRLPLPVESAAVRLDDNELDGGHGVLAPLVVPEGPDSGSDDVSGPPETPLPGAFLPPRAHGPAGSAVAPPSPAGHALIDGVPGLAPTTPPVPEPAPHVGASPQRPIPTPPVKDRLDAAEDLDEDPSMTVSRASLGKRRNTGAPTAPASGPNVQGVWCDVGHPNPATAATCRSCGLPIEQVDAVSMPRPVLGILRFSNGIEVDLDRSVIVGRSPKAERVSASEIPQLVTVPSPDKDISRNHLEVRLDGWHVIVVDLGSTNGTVVTLPGQPPERLRATEEQPISPGTVVTIAEEITFVYEVPS